MAAAADKGAGLVLGLGWTVAGRQAARGETLAPGGAVGGWCGGGGEALSRSAVGAEVWAGFGEVRSERDVVEAGGGGLLGEQVAVLVERVVHLAVEHDDVEGGGDLRSPV